MALTATSTKTTRKFIIDSLSMQLPEIIYIPPVKNNIIYVVLDKPKDIGDYFERIVEKLKVEGIPALLNAQYTESRRLHAV